jgi:hypothetical protein
MRLVKSVDHFKDAARALQTTRDPLLKVMLTADHANKALRMAFDHLQWAGIVGLFGKEGKAYADRVGRTANLFWFLGILSSLAATTYQLEGLARQIKAARQDSDRSAHGRLVRQRQQLLLCLYRDVLDLPIPAFGIGMLPAGLTGLVGLAGTGSSLIGLYQVWAASHDWGKGMGTGRKSPFRQRRAGLRACCFAGVGIRGQEEALGHPHVVAALHILFPPPLSSCLCLPRLSRGTRGWNCMGRSRMEWGWGSM